MTDTPSVAERRVRFGVFELDLRAGELRKRGARVRLQHQPFRVLETMLEHPGQVVTRDELRARLWPSDTFVDFDHGLNKAVNKLREVLGDTAESPRFIETLPKRGYRFIAPVDVTPSASSGRSGVAGADSVSSGVTTRPPDASTAPATQPTSRVRWWMIALGALSVAATAAMLALMTTRPHAPAPGAQAPRTMIAVLPFANTERDPGQEYFCDGLTDEMIVELSRLRPDRLGVIARTSSMQYKGTPKRIDQIARELGVDFLLDGAVRRAGRRVRITATLVRARDQSPLWAESYDRDVSDLIEIQTDVAHRIASSLALELLPDQQVALDRAARPASDAYDAYLRGRYHWNKRTPADLQAAIGYFSDAVVKDASFSASYAGLADALNVAAYYGLQRPHDAYPKSRDAARRALALDDRSAAAHTALAYALHYYDWNWEAAEQEYARALQLNPSYAQAHQWLAAHYSELGRFDAALEEIRQAQRLDPLSLIMRAAEGWINYNGRRYEPAISRLRETLGLDPDFVPARLWLGQTFEAIGRPADAIKEFVRVRHLAGAAPTGMGELARAYALAGRTREARTLLDRLVAIARDRYVEADLFARISIALGEPDAAINWLEKGVGERAAKMASLAVDPQFDPIRDDRRFKDLLHRINLPEQP